jgi:iron-sulfur cluster insertion protein
MMIAPIIVTHQAAAKVWELIEEEGNYALKLRVYVTGGGCSGFQYGFTFDETVNEDDTSVVKQLDNSENSVQVLVDAMSFQYLYGSEIDYLEDLDGARFIIRNPNATTKCGCGSSFAVD